MSDPAAPIIPLDICIDVASWQGTVDWPAVYASGIRIAFVKAMEGVGEHYPTWKPQSEGARLAGLVVIPYLYLRPESPKQVVNAFARVTGLKPGMAFALDWEGRASQTASAEEAEQIGEELAIIAGRKPIGYWGIPGNTPAAPTNRMMGWPRWVPRYPTRGATRFAEVRNAPGESPSLIWKSDTGRLPEFAQYTAWGRVPGVRGDVDRSVAFFPSEAEALAWCRGDAVSELKPAPAHDVIELILSHERFQDGVQGYQRGRGLVPDGIIGPITLAAIGEDMRKTR